MFMQNPGGTPYDLRFSILGIPIRVHPLFWLVSALFGLFSGSVMTMLAWVPAMFLSVLIHELGHAMAGLKFGSRGVRIVLYGFGGLTSNATGHTRKERIAVIAAGPGVEFLFALPFLIVFAKTGFGQSVLARYSMHLAEFAVRFSELTGGNLPNTFPRIMLYFFYFMSLINLFWVVINLFPIYPLDGGQICAEVLMERHPVDGMQMAHKVSVVAAVIEAYLAYRLGFQFCIFFALYFGYINWQMLQRGGRSYW